MIVYLNSRIKSLTLLSSVLLLSACGGSSDSDNNNPEVTEIPPPILELGNTVEVFAGDPVTFTPENIEVGTEEVTYEWEQISGTAIDETNLTSQTLTFTAGPPSDDLSTFRLTVTDSTGQTASDDISLKIKHEYIENYVMTLEQYNPDTQYGWCTTFVRQSFFDKKVDYYSRGEDDMCFTEDDEFDEYDSYVADAVILEPNEAQLKYNWDPNIGSGRLSCDYTHITLDENSLTKQYTEMGYDCTDEMDFNNRESFIEVDTLENGRTMKHYVYMISYAGEKDLFSYEVFNYSSDGYIQDTEYYNNAGEDGVWETSDDEKTWYDEYIYDDQGYLDYELTYKLIEGTFEIVGMKKYVFSDTGLLDHYISYTSAGDDQDWMETSDNNIQRIRHVRRMKIYPLTSLVVEN